MKEPLCPILFCSSKDNTAIARRDLSKGVVWSDVDSAERRQALSWVPVGHRIATSRIAAGSELISWETPFGVALRDIEPGEWLVNDKTLEVFRERGLEDQVPHTPNFKDPDWRSNLSGLISRMGHENDETGNDDVIPGLDDLSHEFDGYDRGMRGVGTRNHVLLLAINPTANPLTESLAATYRSQSNLPPTIDSVEPVCHSEGAGVGVGARNNERRVLRTLAGWITHPNVGAVLLIDSSAGWLNAETLLSWMREHDYPVDVVPLSILQTSDSLEESRTQGLDLLAQLIPQAAKSEKTRLPISKLKIALQCGGSDAFSGVSANPLIGWIARRLVAQGGAANLAETDELIGAEAYLLRKTRTPEVADAFLQKRDAFQAWARSHGHGAEGNPSAGNVFRGLTNIVIKSIGAARKKDPESTLDHVISYGEPMRNSGYHFMDSPGNDLESVAGQVAAGCSLIFFTTGNGSITNFPFVPTLKVMTQSERFLSLKDDMDINAGAYIDGLSMEELGRSAWEKMIQVATGARTVGEKTGLSQTQIWRNWESSGLNDGLIDVDSIHTGDEDESQNENKDQSFNGIQEATELKPISITPLGAAVLNEFWNQLTGAHRIQDPNLSNINPVFRALEWIAPTSLCSGQVALKLARERNQFLREQSTPIRCVATAHTEGCGASGGKSEELFMETMGGYLKRPDILTSLFLEHGCEKTHHGVFRNWILDAGLDPDRFLWESIQGGGGVTSAVSHSLKSLQSKAPSESELHAFIAKQKDSTRRVHQGDWRGVRIGWVNAISSSDYSEEGVCSIANWIRVSASLGAGHFVDQRDPIWRNGRLSAALSGNQDVERESTHKDVRQCQSEEGLVLHGLELPSRDPIEGLTHIGAAGLHLICVLGRRLNLRHPLIPTLNLDPMTLIASTNQGDSLEEPDDLLDHSLEWIRRCLGVWSESPETSDNASLPAVFQISRGKTGVSL